MYKKVMRNIIVVMSHWQFFKQADVYPHMHGLIFETSIWLLAGSTRYNSWQGNVHIYFNMEHKPATAWQWYSNTYQTCLIPLPIARNCSKTWRIPANTQTLGTSAVGFGMFAHDGVLCLACCWLPTNAAHKPRAAHAHESENECHIQRRGPKQLSALAFIRGETVEMESKPVADAISAGFASPSLICCCPNGCTRHFCQCDQTSCPVSLAPLCSKPLLHDVSCFPPAQRDIIATSPLQQYIVACVALLPGYATWPFRKICSPQGCEARHLHILPCCQAALHQGCATKHMFCIAARLCIQTCLLHDLPCKALRHLGVNGLASRLRSPQIVMCTTLNTYNT